MLKISKKLKTGIYISAGKQNLDVHESIPTSHWMDNYSGSDHDR